MSFERLKQEVQKGLDGNNGGIPMGFDRLNNYIGIRKSIYTLIGAGTGLGKTSFLDDCYVLNPFDWSISPEGKKSKLKIKFWYRSMERNAVYKYAKWTCRKIFLDTGIIISTEKLLGWNKRMTKDEHDLFLTYEDYMNELKESVIMFENPENPVGIAKDLKKYALEKGKIEEIDEFNKIYVPNNSNEITLVILDHIGLLKSTTELSSKSQRIEKMSNELRFARDFYGFSPVVISQFNRTIANPTRLKANDVEPTLEDFSDSSVTQNDADVVLSLFDPSRYKVSDPSGYDLEALVDDYGSSCYRSLKILKNSYGADNVRIGLGFFGQLGMFKELKKQKEITEKDYENVINKKWFRQ